MCLGIPMEIVALDGHRARCRALGIEREVSLFMLQDQTVALGDYVLVHVGYAIQKVDRAHGAQTLDLLRDLGPADHA